MEQQQQQRRQNGGPLSGYIILDLTRMLAGPICSKILFDLGARVIKVEPPSGDGTRGIKPMTSHNVSHYFTPQNYGKESIVLDLKNNQEDRKFFEQKLLPNVDVLLENFRPGVMKNLNYSWHQIHSQYPHIVMASISGFGQNGPKSNRRALDTIIQAAAGIMSITGWPETGYTKAGPSLSDLCAGMYGAMGVQAALIERLKTGKTNHVDISMLDSSFSLMLLHMSRYLSNGEDLGLIGNMHPVASPFGLFKAKTSTYLAIAAPSPAHFKILCNVIQKPELLSNEKYKSPGRRKKFQNELKWELEDGLKTKTAKEWAELLGNAGVSAMNMQTVSDLVEDEQLKHRNMIVKLKHETDDDDNNTDNINKINSSSPLSVGTPLKFSGFVDSKTKPAAPKLNEHGDKIKEEFNNKSNKNKNSEERYYSHRGTTVQQVIQIANDIIDNNQNLAMVHTYNNKNNVSGLSARLCGVRFVNLNTLRHAILTTNPQTRKYSQIGKDGRVVVTFADKQSQGYVVFHGKAEIIDDILQKSKIYDSRFPTGSDSEKFGNSAFPGGANGPNFGIIKITFEEIEMINHDLPAKKNTVADHPQGWKPLTLIWENNQWMIKPDDGRVIMLHHSNGHSFNNSKL